jgi:negative regulator of sigma-B (phosphoserine phosphatase)
MIEWAVAQRALPGQGVSGDLHLVAFHPRGVLLAVVDGVGHGPEATRAAETAVGVLRRQPAESVLALVQRCHEALRPTRGVVMTLASLDTGAETISWLGVGNVEGHLYRANGTFPACETALLRGGLVGAQLPSLSASVAPVHPGDLLVLASDGIRSDFEQSAVARGPPQRVADHVLQKYFKGTDDALVLVVRYLGLAHE